MRREQRKAQYLAAVAPQQFTNGAHVAQGLGHFLAPQVHIGVVHPVAHKLSAVGAAALGQFVFMMRKDQIPTAAMNIYRRTEMLANHRRALQMPARAAPPPGAVPAGLVIRGRFPQHKVAGVALVVRDLNARAGQHVGQRPPRQAPVVRHRLDGEQHMARRLVGVLPGDQRLNEREHGADVLRCARLKARRQGVQGGHIFAILVGKLPRYGVDTRIALTRGGDDLVVDIGDVARVDHLVEQRAQQAIQGVENHHRPGVADMRQVVDRRPAHVQGHPMLIDRHEGLFLAGPGIEQLQAHGGLPRASLATLPAETLPAHTSRRPMVRLKTRRPLPCSKRSATK